MKTRMTVVRRLAALLAALVLTAVVTITTALFVAHNTAATAEGLGVIGFPDTLLATLPMGGLFDALWPGVTFRAVAAAAFAVGVFVLSLAALHGALRVASSWWTTDNRPASAFVHTHVVDVLLVSGLVLSALAAVSFDIYLWRVRSLVDLTIGERGAMSWLWLPLANGTVADTAGQVINYGAFAFAGLTVGLGLALEACGRWIGIAWSDLAEALEAQAATATLRKGHPWLDVVVRVIGGSPDDRVSRATALLNPDRFNVDASGHVFDRAYLERLETHARARETAEKIKQSPVERGRSRRLHGAALAVLIGGPLAAGRVSAAQVDENVPRVKILVGLDLSGTTDRTRAERVALTRRLIADLDPTAAVISRHTPTAHYAVRLVAIDAFGGEVLWEGTELTMKELTDDWWERVQVGRKGYGTCTRLGPFWREAGEFLGTLGRCDHGALLVLSDLVAEEPTGTTGKCRPPVYGPSPEVPWDVLGRLDLVRAYFTPERVKAAWEPALASHGLSDRVRFFGGSDPTGKLPFVGAMACGASPEEHARAVGLVQRGLLAIGAIIVGALALPFLLGRGARS